MNITFNNKVARGAMIGLACSAFALLAGCSANSDAGSGNNGNGGTPPTVTFSATPPNVTTGGTTTLTWTSTGASSCSGTGGDAADHDGWSGQSGTSGTHTTTALNTPGTYTYTLTCMASGGATTVYNTSVVVATATTGNPPTVSFSATPTTVATGGTTTLNWSSNGATSCAATGGDTADNDGWNGKTGTSGTYTTTALTSNGNYTYTLTCIASNGSTTVNNIAVMVGAIASPTVNISANPATVASGATSTLTWTTANAVSCSAVPNSDAGWTGSKPTSGTFTTTAVTGPASVSYTLQCTGPVTSGSPTGSNTAVVTTNAAGTPPPAFNLALTANPTQVAIGGTSVLSWGTTNATSCTASGGDPSGTWTGSMPTSGTFTTSALNTNGVYSYTLSCTGTGGTTAQTVVVTAGAQGTPSVTVLINGQPTATLDLATAQSATLSWTSANVDSCLASGSWSGAQAASGSVSTGVLTTDGVYSYSLTCSGSSQVVSTATLTVTGIAPPGPTSCGVGDNSMALINANSADTTFTTATFPNCGLLGLCSMSNPGNVIKPAPISTANTHFGTLTDTLGLLSSGNIAFSVVNSTDSFSYPAGRQAGFLVANPNQMLSAGALSPISLQTLLRDGNGTEQVQETVGSNGAPINPTLLGLLGNDNLQFLSFTTTKPFDAIQITEGTGVASINTQINIYAACVADPFP